MHHHGDISSVIFGYFLNRHSLSRGCFILLALLKGSLVMVLEPNLATQLMLQL